MTFADLVALVTRQLPRAHSDATQYVRVLSQVGLLRRPRPTAFEAAIHEPVFILVLQGRKTTVLGTDSYSLGPGDCMLVSHDLPVVARITKAPYLALVFDIAMDTLQEFRESLGEPATAAPCRSLSVHGCDASLADALGRYVALADTPGDAHALAPLFSREIHYRLATAPFGGMLRSLMNQESHAGAIARAIAQLRKGFRAPIKVPQLARSVGMSAPTFHRHFKAITASTPVQYRKSLQLLEARRLLRNGSLSVTDAAFDVGYESPAQFSRDYRRKFGTAPKHDVPT